MKIIADTNILVRAIADDDMVQSPIAKAQLDEAELVALTLPALCELCWVFLRGYKVSRHEMAETIRVLVSASNVKVDGQAVEAGLAMLDEGGDFADGVIAHDGQWLGGDTFVSFDRDAIGLLQKHGQAAIIPA
ncbi:MAG: type II toxin-antitoxin system VapC family toxin [Sphingopyxis sp.]|jgi:predicted nucleic-acid-binding protein|uniref:type II toxin-antitoxin system VapC family toxin n=1 Tax=Sphingopyxis sp. TaxID=1908224 RepID=UPI003D6D3682